MQLKHPFLPPHLASKTTFLAAVLVCTLFLLLNTGSNFNFTEFRHCSDGSATQQISDNLAANRKDDANHWMKIPSTFNFTEKFIRTIEENGTRSCHHVTTERTHLYGLATPENGGTIRLRAGLVHELLLVAYDDAGRRRCNGGDYFETELSGPIWKSHPPITDLGDGSYSILLQVHPDFAGIYDFKIILLFTNFHGLHRRPERWARDEVMLNVEIEFFHAESLQAQEFEGMDSGGEMLAPLRRCRAKDFRLQAWTGRWIQMKSRSNCTVNEEGRFLCLDRNEPCVSPWCEGPLGVLESNGWVYSAHCSFKLFSEEEAWNCLNRKWIFFWGDSNHVDTIRNLLNFVLGFDNVTEVPRRFDRTFYRQSNRSESVRITSLFNGHSNETLNHQGLFSLNDSAFRQQILTYFSGASVPNVVIMNSGLHDGLYWKYVDKYVAEGVLTAIDFWSSIMTKLRNRGLQPRVIYRTTIATATWARSCGFNPYKMEAFNKIFVEKLKLSVPSLVVDGFDLTYPWHFDNNCSDGVHYEYRTLQDDGEDNSIKVIQSTQFLGRCAVHKGATSKAACLPRKNSRPKEVYTEIVMRESLRSLWRRVLWRNSSKFASVME